MYARRITGERVGSRDVVNIHPGPYPIGITERVQARFARNTGAGQDDDVSRAEFTSAVLPRRHPESVCSWTATPRSIVPSSQPSANPGGYAENSPIGRLRVPVRSSGCTHQRGSTEDVKSDRDRGGLKRQG